MFHQNRESYPRDQHYFRSKCLIRMGNLIPETNIISLHWMQLHSRAVLCAVKFSYCKFCSQHHNLVFDYFNHKFFFLDITRLKKVGTSFLRKKSIIFTRALDDGKVDISPIIKWMGICANHWFYTSELDSHQLNQESQINIQVNWTATSWTKNHRSGTQRIRPRGKC